jgi:hypothetical protein
MQLSRRISKTADDCSICMASMSVDSVLVTTACNHRFHFDCLTKKIQVSLSNECPLCHAPFGSLINGLEDCGDQEQVLQQPTYASKIRRRASYQPAQSQEQYHFEQQPSVSYVAIMLRQKREAFCTITHAHPHDLIEFFFSNFLKTMILFVECSWNNQ